MIGDLNRLQGSGLLLDEFDAFLGKWLPHLPAKPEVEIEELIVDSDIIFADLQYEVQRFYQILNGRLACLFDREFDRWDNMIVLPQIPQTTRFEIDWGAETLNLISFPNPKAHEFVEVGLNIEDIAKENPLQIHSDEHGNTLLDWRELQQPLDKFLVTSLLLVIFERSTVSNDEVDVVEARTIFTAEDWSGMPIQILWHDSGSLYLESVDSVLRLDSDGFGKYHDPYA